MEVLHYSTLNTVTRRNTQRSNVQFLPGVVVQVVPPSKYPREHSALVQDVPRTFCPRVECPQGTLYPRADCPLLVQNVPPSIGKQLESGASAL